MDPIDLDATDRRILNLLQDNCRITNSDLANSVHLSASSCLRRVQRLESSGLIDRCAMLIKPEKVGKPISVYVEVSLNAQNDQALQAFEEAVSACDKIMECHLMSGDFDYLIKVIAEDTQDYEQIHRGYLANFPHVARIRTNFTLRTIFKRTKIPL